MARVSSAVALRSAARPSRSSIKAGNPEVADSAEVDAGSGDVAQATRHAVIPRVTNRLKKPEIRYAIMMTSTHYAFIFIGDTKLDTRAKGERSRAA
jgi:hypothetical protein